MKKFVLLLFILFLFIACNQKIEKSGPDQLIIKSGSELFSKYGCIVCHSLEGKDIYGPPLNNIYMKEVKVIRKGEELTLVADRAYLKKAISHPRYEKVKEYSNKDMPETYFSEKEVDILVDYIIVLNKNENKQP